MMKMTETAIRVKGKTVVVPTTFVCDREIIITGRWLTLASIKDEDFQEGEAVSDPWQFVSGLRQQKSLKADVFTFSQKPDDTTPKFALNYDWDSVAAIPIESYLKWWTNRVSHDLRRDIKRSVKRGVVVQSVPFTDDFVRGIMEIYDEKPVRQGKAFWHYKKGFEAVKLETGTYLERSEFLAALLGEELIGYLKIVYVNRLGRLMQILSKVAHQDKRPANALIAKAVEVCAARGCSHLTYGKYRYNKGPESSLTAFKKRNGFEEILVPKYYVPLTLKGNLALHMNLHRGFKALVPPRIRRSLLFLRALSCSVQKSICRPPI